MAAGVLIACGKGTRARPRVVTTSQEDGTSTYNTVAIQAAGHFTWHKVHSETVMFYEHECRSQITRILKNSNKSMIKLRKTTTAPQTIADSATGIRIRYLSAGSIPDGVFEIFHWNNPSGRTMVLVSTQPLSEMSTRCISWG